jgi:hypothetical protein
MPDLKLIALDAEDLSVISAHLQDAALTVGDIAYVPKDRRFVALANRFDWMGALASGKREEAEFTRRRAAIRFERVLGAQVQGIDLNDKRKVLSLLAVSFEPASLPEGHVTLHFAEGAAVKLHVECIEAGLSDLGAAWEADSKPEHPEDRKG